MPVLVYVSRSTARRQKGKRETQTYTHTSSTDKTATLSQSLWLVDSYVFVVLYIFIYIFVCFFFFQRVLQQFIRCISALHSIQQLFIPYVCTPVCLPLLPLLLPLLLHVLLLCCAENKTFGWSHSFHEKLIYRWQVYILVSVKLDGNGRAIDRPNQFRSRHTECIWAYRFVCVSFVFFFLLLLLCYAFFLFCLLPLSLLPCYLCAFCCGFRVYPDHFGRSHCSVASCKPNDNRFGDCGQQNQT